MRASWPHDGGPRPALAAADPGHGPLYNAQAKLELEQGDTEAARAVLSEAVGKYPSAETYFELRYSKFHALHTQLRDAGADQSMLDRAARLRDQLQGLDVLAAAAQRCRRDCSRRRAAGCRA